MNITENLFNQTWYQIDAMTLYVLVINRNAGNLFCIIMSIKEDIICTTKKYRKMKLKLSISQLLSVSYYKKLGTRLIHRFNSFNLIHI